MKPCHLCRMELPEKEMVSLNGILICAACKPTYVQALQEGLSGPSHADNASQALIARECQLERGIVAFRQEVTYRLPKSCPFTAGEATCWCTLPSSPKRFRLFVSRRGYWRLQFFIACALFLSILAALAVFAVCAFLITPFFRLGLILIFLPITLIAAGLPGHKLWSIVVGGAGVHIIKSNKDIIIIRFRNLDYAMRVYQLNQEQPSDSS